MDQSEVGINTVQYHNNTNHGWIKKIFVLGVTEVNTSTGLVLVQIVVPIILDS